MLVALVALVSVVCAIGGVYASEAILQEVRKIRNDLRNNNKEKNNDDK